MVNPAEGAEMAEDGAAEGRSGERVVEEWGWQVVAVEAEDLMGV